MQEDLQIFFDSALRFKTVSGDEFSLELVDLDDALFQNRIQIIKRIDNADVFLDMLKKTNSIDELVICWIQWRIVLVQ